MSFLNDILDIGSNVWNWASGNSTSAGIARATALGYMLKEVQASINKDNERPSSTSTDSTPEVDYGVREEVDPDTEHKIPVIYGDAYIRGIVTDAVLSSDNLTMWYCITLCEKTGIKMSDNAQSIIQFKALYWNGSKVVFRSDGKTATKLVDDDGNESSDIDGLVEVYPYRAGSITPTGFVGSPQTNYSHAYGIFPNWTSNHLMSDLVFALIKVKYSKEKNITGLGNLEFHLSNNMRMPGDVLNDFMSNTRYGCGITTEEIYKK